jgi:hypothetical protein
MSSEFHSSNPFRRKTTTTSPPVEDPLFHGHSASAQQSFLLPASHTDAIDQIRVQSKPVKKVRVQSPPPSSPEADSIPHGFPTPISRPDDFPSTDNDPFENATTDSSEDSGDETETLNSTSVPSNPFQKTLATQERTDGADSFNTPSHISTLGGTGVGRGPLDVEAFKRLLMTGSADAAVPASGLAPPINLGQLALNDGSSSTDASSSASRQSIFEPTQEIHPESPRTSHEVSDPDDERRRFATDGLAPSERRKPPPPSSRHGKLIRVELRDENTPRIDTSLLPGRKGPEQSSISPKSAQSIRSPTDLNKPLPAVPTRASHESDRESVFDKEAAGKTPEPASPSSTQTRKTPPAPPLTRRHSQLVSESKAARPASVRLPTNTEEGEMSLSSYENVLSQSTNKAPPLPPVRRPASIRNSSQTDSIPASTSPPQEQQRPMSKSGSAPAPPPARMASARHSSRPPSVMSMDLTSKRVSTAPPPPPPPRQRASSRTSMEGPVLSSESSRRTSSDYFRKSIDSTREENMASQSDHGGLAEGSSGAINILADLTALQREVDALRGQYEMRGTG